PIRQVNMLIPDDLVAVIDKLHSKDAAGRYQSADEVAAVLGKMLARVQQDSDVTTRHAAAPGWKPARGRAAARRAWPWLAALLVGVGLLAAGAAYVWTDRGVLEVRGDVEGGEVVVEHDGRVVGMIDAHSGRKLALASGVYRLRAGGPKAG